MLEFLISSSPTTNFILFITKFISVSNIPGNISNFEIPSDIERLKLISRLKHLEMYKLINNNLKILFKKNI